VKPSSILLIDHRFRVGRQPGLAAPAAVSPAPTLVGASKQGNSRRLDWRIHDFMLPEGNGDIQPQ